MTKSLCARASILVILLMPLASTASAANVYIRAGASGDGTGVDWTNACTGFTDLCNPLSLVRGNVYYVADGDYKAAGQLTFSTPVSGTAVITIRKATIADHGTEIGWKNAYGVGQAVFRAITITSDYWLIDGAIRNDSNWKDYVAYGFRIHNSIGPFYNALGAVNAGNASNSVSHITFRYLDVIGSRLDVQGVAMIRDSGFRFVPPAGAQALDITVSRSTSRDVGADNVQIREVDDVVIEYSYIARNDSDLANAKHTQGFDGSTSMRGLTIRHNWFEDIVGTAFITNPASSIAARFGDNGYSSNWYLYGNLFTRSAADSMPTCTSAVIRMLPGEHRGDFVVVNNTIAGVRALTCSTTNEASIRFDAGGSYKYATALIKNNLFAASTGFIADTSGSGNQFANLAWSHQSYFGMVGRMTDSDSNAEFVGISPFLSIGEDKYALAFATKPGVGLATPYNTDRNGAMRGADGRWDRGAVECVSCVDRVLPIPSNLRIVK